ncbi:DUF983 domain-containing protein [Bosea sp. (in: a-proteobacteria)]|jgi:uncharacterized protein (DUF983 family)|uniref:DUF983 domain-containing protein n=1 Tax=Bosea sp. (in: a-proteobacteria) TaxID=1871050 RepID=UPI002732D754|nr:DUF983 domain-containing protein [Bosea sp. (in: a-proteobacteria)]MDP3409063.1 DUF983 domain-containing protein [Bosea sp. (in: a-proteobacteria)]
MPVQMNTILDEPVARDWRSAVGRGLRGRCPHCGEGRLFKGFLKPVDACAACGELLHHQRADDLPPYVVITIVGHIVVGGLLMAEKYADWSMGLHMAIWPALTVVLSLILMQPVKGGVIGLQWAMRMHGFGGMPDLPERQPLPPAGRPS